MNELKGACLLAQSGGPTSVINASLYGALRAALADGRITRVLGAAHGVKGILDDVLWDLGQEDPKELSYLPNTPSSILGSCRYKLADPAKDDRDYRRILEIFKSTMCAISSISAGTTAWIPATRSAALWRTPAGNAGSWGSPRPSTTT